jgi:hypothetical protein
MKTLNINPEFGYELAISAPYAFFHHNRGEYLKVTTCEGMKPFYWFCDEVYETHKHRSVDNNNNGMQHLPNNWIHHNAKAIFGMDYSELTHEEQVQANGWLDYSEWLAPPYKSHYYDSNLDCPENFVVVCNRYNLEHGREPIGYFDLESLCSIFKSLTSKGYSVIYKRPNNTEFSNDCNELHGKNITGDVDGYNNITDYDLASTMDQVYLFDDVIKKINGNYNESQLKLFSRSSGFISMGGGNSIFCSYFDVPVIIYVNVSKDVREGYFDGNSYFRKLSKAEVYPVVDKRNDILKRGYRDYSLVHEFIEKKL